MVWIHLIYNLGPIIICFYHRNEGSFQMPVQVHTLSLCYFYAFIQAISVSKWKEIYCRVTYICEYHIHQHLKYRAPPPTLGEQRNILQFSKILFCGGVTNSWWLGRRDFWKTKKTEGDSHPRLGKRKRCRIMTKKNQSSFEVSGPKFKARAVGMGFLFVWLLGFRFKMKGISISYTVYPLNVLHHIHFIKLLPTCNFAPRWLIGIC